MSSRNSRGQFTSKNNFDLSLPHPFTILKYLIIFIVVFPWYKFITKTDLLDMIYRKVGPECPKQDCSICPKEKEVIVGHCKPCDKECKPCEICGEKVCPPCDLVYDGKVCPTPKPCPVCPKCLEE